MRIVPSLKKQRYARLLEEFWKVCGRSSSCKINKKQCKEGVFGKNLLMMSWNLMWMELWIVSLDV